MKRTFNYTGRRKIDRKDVAITLKENHEGLIFDADLRLAPYRFPHNAEIWIEAHRQNLWMQWNWGTISALRPAPNRTLSEFDVPEGLLFRVRIVQPPGLEHRKLLGEVDGITFVKLGEADDRKRHLLVPIPENLGQQLWKLDLDSDPPRLLVNKDAKPTWKDMVKTPEFIALVYPEVLRRLLSNVLIDDKWEEDGEEGSGADWVKFARNVGGLGPLPSSSSEDERRSWIEEAVAAFSRYNRFCETWNLSFEKETNR